MITEVQIWALAEDLIRQYGADAWSHAAARAREMLAGGDAEGQLTWQRIACRIEQVRPDSREKARKFTQALACLEGERDGAMPFPELLRSQQ